MPKLNNTMNELLQDALLCHSDSSVAQLYFVYPFTIFSVWRDTTSETVDPGPIFFALITIIFILFCSLVRSTLFSTIRLISLFSADQEDWQPSCKLGQSESLSVVCRPLSTKLSGTIDTLLKSLKSYWIDNLGLNRSRESLLSTTSKPYSWGSQLDTRVPSSFLAPLPGTWKFQQGESHTSNLFTSFLVLLSLLF